MNEATWPIDSSNTMNKNHRLDISSTLKETENMHTRCFGENTMHKLLSF